MSGINLGDQVVFRSFEVQKERFAADFRIPSRAMSLQRIEDIRDAIDDGLYRIEMMLWGREIVVDKVARKEVHRYPATAKDAFFSTLADALGRWPRLFARTQAKLAKRVKWVSVAQEIHVHHIHACPHVEFGRGYDRACFPFLASSVPWEGSGAELSALRKLADAVRDSPQWNSPEWNREAYLFERAKREFEATQLRSNDFSRFFEPPNADHRS